MQYLNPCSTLFSSFFFSTIPHCSLHLTPPHDTLILQLFDVYAKFSSLVSSYTTTDLVGQLSNQSNILCNQAAIPRLWLASQPASQSVGLSDQLSASLPVCIFSSICVRAHLHLSNTHSHMHTHSHTCTMPVILVVWLMLTDCHNCRITV